MSIAGGYYKAVERAAEVGCTVLQCFTKNNNQWRAKAITPAEAERFKESLKTLGISDPISHDSYLINLASPDEPLWKKSIDAFVIELLRAEQLGIKYVVTHPGSYTTSSEEEGLKQIIRALDEVHSQTPKVTSCCLLENTAGQGSNLGWRFEHLATIIDGVKSPERLGVCIDTCHTFAAGYPLETAKEYKATMSELDKTVGVKLVKAFHLNDSKRELGSRVDRHEHIGRGRLGLAPFEHLLNDARYRKVPMYLETPKEQLDGEPADVVNLRTLRGLVEKK
ncbi:MAG: deoxyribonuclease IV [Planctomycetia bacterium]|nr:deoxyribonuclease IV [Planctomycetia bacterium]